MMWCNLHMLLFHQGTGHCVEEMHDDFTEEGKD